MIFHANYKKEVRVHDLVETTDGKVCEVIQITTVTDTSGQIQPAIWIQPNDLNLISLPEWIRFSKRFQLVGEQINQLKHLGYSWKIKP